MAVPKTAEGEDIGRVTLFYRDGSGAYVPYPAPSSSGGGGASSGVYPDADGVQAVRVGGKDNKTGVFRTFLTDLAGRTKISHGQPPILSVNLDTIGDALIIGTDGFADAMIFCTGTNHSGFTLTFEYSPNTTATPGKMSASTPADGDWFPIAGKNTDGSQGASRQAGPLPTNGSISFEMSAPASVAVRARVTNLTAGTLVMLGTASTAARPTNMTVAGSVQLSGLSSTALRVVSGQQDETTTALAASGSYVGGTRDHGSDPTGRPTRYRWVYQASAAALGSVAHLFLDESSDGTTWRPAQQTPLPADGSVHTGEWATGHYRYWRVRVVNGGVAQTVLLVSGVLVRGDGSTADTRANLAIPCTTLSGRIMGASEVFQTPILDLGANHQWDRIRTGIRNSDAAAAGTWYYEGSNDGFSSDITGIGATVTAGVNTWSELERPVVGYRYWRVRYSNGTTASTVGVRIVMSLVSL